jgi:hypothetical protein
MERRNLPMASLTGGKSGFYLPFAIQDRQFLSDSFKLRTLFVSPHAEQRNFFYGVNFEFSNEPPKFSQTRFGLEIRPIIGVRNADYEFIVNPIVDIGLGKNGEADFAPAARLARKLGEDLYAGFEYYSDLGEIGNFNKPSDQQHTLFAVTDFQAWRLWRELRRRPRFNAGLRSLGHQDDRGLCVSSARRQSRRERTRYKLRTCQSHGACFGAALSTLTQVLRRRAHLANRNLQKTDIATS